MVLDFSVRKALVRAIILCRLMQLQLGDGKRHLYPSTQELYRFLRILDRRIPGLSAVIIVISVSIISLALSMHDGLRTFIELQAPHDAFGIKRLYKSDISGPFWDSQSWYQTARSLFSPQIDPEDPYFHVRGSKNLVVIRGDGIAESSGPQVRYYIADPQGQKEWKNFEFTMYSMRISESFPPSYAGFAVQGRTGPGHTDKPGMNSVGYPIQCDGSSYSAAIRYTGTADFKKEIKWPNYTKQNPITTLYPDGVPKDRWIGMKFVIYNINGDQDVKMELWIDETNGRNGGHWVKIMEHIDSGGWAISSTEEASSCDYSTEEKLLAGGPAIIVRNDGVDKQLYKNMSIREIIVTQDMNMIHQ
jgi:hypothetical protein